MKKLLYFLLNLNIMNAQNANPEILDSRIINTVVQIQFDKTFGSGFLVKSGEKTLLVTNKHLIGYWTPVDDIILAEKIEVILYGGKEGDIKPINFKLHISTKGIPNSNLKLHSNPKIDIAAIDISESVKFLLSTYGLKNTNYIDTSMFKTLNEINHIFSYGSEVFAIGYPAGLKSFLTNQPIVKTVNLASSLDGKMVWNQLWINRSGDTIEVKTEGSTFIVDGNIIGGNSGGPIVTSKEIKFIEVDKTHLSTHGLENYIIGIVSSIWNSTGITLIFSSDNILEVIRQFK